jgi:acyl carrier protein
MTDIADDILDIVSSETRRDRSTVSLDTKVSEVESLDLVQIIFAIEDRYQIYIPQDEDGGLDLETLRDVVEGVQRLIAEKQQSGAA